MNNAQINADLAATLAFGAVEGGVRHVVISPGARSAPLALAFARAAETPRGPRLHVLTDERTAGFFALGLARATRTVVALICTSGSAPAHYLPALIEASEDRLPLLVLTADRPPELQSCGAGQTVDQVRLFGSHVRFFRDLGVPPGPGAQVGYAATALAQALDAARRSPAGPVHLNIPFREPLFAPGVVGTPARRLPAVERADTSTFDEALWEPVVEALSGKTRPVIVCGPHAWTGSGNFGFNVDLLAGHLGAPLLADVASQLRFLRPRRPDAQRRAPWAREALAMVRGDVAEGNAVASVEALLRTTSFTERYRPDAVIRIGRMPSSRTVQTWLSGLGPETTFVNVDPQGDLHDPLHRADVAVAGDPRHLLRALAPLELKNPVWQARWSEADALAQAALSGVCAQGFWEGGLARRLVEGLPEGVALHLASSMPIRNVDAFAPKRPLELPVFTNRGANGIDGTIATALGVATGREGRVAVLCGDLALLHDVGSLIAARSLPEQAVTSGERTEGASSGLGGRQPGGVTIVVMNNGGGGIFGFLPMAEPGAVAAGDLERLFRTPHRADFADISRAAGARHARTFDYEDFDRALARELDSPGLGVIECVVDAAQDRELHRGAWDAVAQGLEWLTRTGS